MKFEHVFFYLNVITSKKPCYKVILAITIQSFHLLITKCQINIKCMAEWLTAWYDQYQAGLDILVLCYFI